MQPWNPKESTGGDGLTPDGLTTYPFSQGKALCWDAPCVNTYNETSVNECAMEAGSAAKKKENEKRAKYPEMVRRFQLEPIAI